MKLFVKNHLIYHNTNKIKTHFLLHVQLAIQQLIKALKLMSLLQHNIALFKILHYCLTEQHVPIDVLQ